MLPKGRTIRLYQINGLEDSAGRPVKALGPVSRSLVSKARCFFSEKKSNFLLRLLLICPCHVLHVTYEDRTQANVLTRSKVVARNGFGLDVSSRRNRQLFVRLL